MSIGERRAPAESAPLLGEEALAAALAVSGPMVFVDNDEHRRHQVGRILAALEPPVAVLVAERERLARIDERLRCAAACDRLGFSILAGIIRDSAA